MAKQTVRDIMSSPPVTCDISEPLDRVARIMQERHCGFIPVLRNGGVAGVLTDRDVTIRCVAQSKNPMEMTAGEIMTTNFYSVDVADPIDKAMMLMEHRQVRRLPVFDKGAIVGVVSQANLVANLAPHRGSELVKLISRATWRLATPH